MTAVDVADCMGDCSLESLFNSRRARGWFCTAQTVLVKAASARSANDTLRSSP
jgi:hypothetical protein